MSCERYRDALTDAAAGGPVAPALEAHLAGCAGCRSELAELRQLMAAADDQLSPLAVAEPSPALRVRIREAVADQGVAPVLRWRFAWLGRGGGSCGGGGVRLLAHGARSSSGRAGRRAGCVAPGRRCRGPRLDRAPVGRVAGIGPQAAASAAASDPAATGSSRSPSAVPATRRPSSAGLTARRVRLATPSPRCSFRPANRRRCCASSRSSIASGSHAPALAAAGRPRPTSPSRSRRHPAARDRPARPGRETRRRDEQEKKRRSPWPVALPSSPSPFWLPPSASRSRAGDERSRAAKAETPKPETQAGLPSRVPNAARPRSCACSS